MSIGRLDEQQPLSRPTRRGSVEDINRDTGQLTVNRQHKSIKYRVVVSEAKSGAGQRRTVMLGDHTLTCLKRWQETRTPGSSTPDCTRRAHQRRVRIAVVSRALRAQLGADHPEDLQGAVQRGEGEDGRRGGTLVWKDRAVATGPVSS
jgi:hypothetical protein